MDKYIKNEIRLAPLNPSCMICGKLLNLFIGSISLEKEATTPAKIYIWIID